MSKNVIDSLNEWTKQGPPDFIADWEGSVEGEMEDPKPVTKVTPLEKDWKPEVSSPELAAMALCRIVRYAGNDAECAVFVDGFELPRVSFPAWVLRRNDLDVGGRFIWIMRNPSRIRPTDIDTGVPQKDMLTAEERAQLDNLYKVSDQRRVEDGGVWPEYTGPGR